MTTTEALALGFAIGVVVMYGVVFLFPGMMPLGWFKTRWDELRRQRRRTEEIRALQAKAASGLTGDVMEHYKTLITRNDIERDATISIRGRVRDLITDVKREKAVRHLIQLVFVDWDPEQTVLWREADLVQFMHKAYTQEPALPFFLEPNSIPPVLELIYAAERGIPPLPEMKPPLGTMEELHSRFVPEARKYFEGIIDDHAVADRVADECVARIETAIRRALRIPELGAPGDDPGNETLTMISLKPRRAAARR